MPCQHRRSVREGDLDTILFFERFGNEVGVGGAFVGVFAAVEAVGVDNAVGAVGAAVRAEGVGGGVELVWVCAIDTEEGAVLRD